MSSSEDRRARSRQTLVQFLKFGIVGGSGFVVNIVVAIIMNKLNGGAQNYRNVLMPLPGGWNLRFTHLVWIVAFLIANPFNFQLNRWWTFKSSKHARWWSEFWPFFLVGGIAAIVGFFLKHWMTHPGSWLYLSHSFFTDQKGFQSREYWSQIFAVILTIPINFLVNKVWTFRSVRHLDPDAEPKQ